MMTIERVIAAVQRSTHMTRRKMSLVYPELFKIRFDLELEQIRWEVASRKHEILGRCPLDDRQFAPEQINLARGVCPPLLAYGFPAGVQQVRAHMIRPDHLVRLKYAPPSKFDKQTDWYRLS
jgi:hypothetical protein